MSSHPPVKLSVIRDIAWKEWDPIGLASMEGGLESSGVADEYDGYLLHVAARLQNGEPDRAVVDYLVGVELDHMGLSRTASTQTRAAATVAALRTYVESLT
ncbi:hypothetical protein [Aquisediminimonas profunda]|uniref:hypothetical protein n=1 Tax=Aquisediminimonas profunda TaxID=1550733 RepID=UPI001C635E82|nr:hypothetical protein [Aquisediminimonas profunda]